jgi:large subunit ribosomal protein L22
VPETRASLRHLRTSPSKIREVLGLIRGREIDDARERLRFSTRGPAGDVLKLLDSAVANAETNQSLPEDELFVARAYADEGPTLKRWRPRARGRGTRIRKRTSHVTIVLSRFSDEELERRRQREAATGPTRRLRRPTRRRRVREVEEEEEHDHEHDEELREELGEELPEVEDTGEDVALADVPDVADIDAEAQPLEAGGPAAPAEKAPAKKKVPATKKPTKKATTAKKPTAKKTTAKKPQKTTKKTTKKKDD